MKVTQCCISDISLYDMYVNTSSGWTWVEQITERISPEQERTPSQESTTRSPRSFRSHTSKNMSSEVSVTTSPLPAALSMECPLHHENDCSICTAGFYINIIFIYLNSICEAVVLITLLMLVGIVTGGLLLYKKRNTSRKEEDKIEPIEPTEPKKHQMSFRKDRNLTKSIK